MQELLYTDQPIEELGPYVVGEAPGNHRHTFEDDDGDPIDISGYTIVWIQGRISDPTGTVETISGSVDDGPNGVALVVFGKEAWDVAGEYYGRFWAYTGVDFANRIVAITSHLYRIVVKDDPLPSPS